MRKNANRKQRKLVWLVFSIVSMTMVVISFFLSNMGEDVLKYKFIKSISMLLLGICFLLPLVVRFLQEEEASTMNGRRQGETLAEMMENGTGHVSIRNIISLLVGIALVWSGAKSVVACAGDMSSGPVWISLESTRVEETGSYKLLGLANGKEYIFQLEEPEMYENLMRKINYQVPEIIVVYYPQSKAIIQVQIFFEDNEKVVLPAGDRAYDRGSLDKLPQGEGEEIEDSSRYEEDDNDSISKVTPEPGVYAPTTPSYAKVDVEDLQLTKIMVGTDFKELIQGKVDLPEEEQYEMKMVFADDYMEHMKKVVEVKEVYSVQESQGCDILYKGDIELIVVYNKETYVIEAIYARRLLTF